ncbi:MAG TPA: Spy/CpxP family protein refolding chaperone [Gemmatimonadales bacterium]|nr:Spy/CpxP family protein refolding chaperone [Gemmatimonadales bacterium]
MRRSLSVVPALLLFAAPLFAQGGGMGGMGRMAPPPDHWMTKDSLVAAVGLSADQTSKIQAAYDSLNNVMKNAAAARTKARQEMMSQSGGGPPSDEMRNKMRTEMQGLQTALDAQYQLIRAALTSDQQAKFDALPKPAVMRQRPAGM